MSFYPFSKQGDKLFTVNRSWSTLYIRICHVLAQNAANSKTQKTQANWEKSSKMKNCLVFLFLIIISLIGLSEFVAQCHGDGDGGELRTNFYEKSCPLAQHIVQTITWKRVASNSTLPAKFLRMHFHDCFVRVNFTTFHDNLLVVMTVSTFVNNFFFLVQICRIILATFILHIYVTQLTV